LRTGEYPDQNKQYKEIEISTLKGVLVELGLKTSLGTGLYSLIDSGFGYSQLLPILIRGLLASKDSSLIIEQPELHLNPAIQVRIANFLAAMATAGKQVIVETHSEHIVNSIRVLAAEDESGELSQISSIFYVDVKSQSGQIELHELSIKPDGTVPKWPRQFFGEAASLTGRLLKAQKRFRTYK